MPAHNNRVYALNRLNRIEINCHDQSFGTDYPCRQLGPAAGCRANIQHPPTPFQDIEALLQFLQLVDRPGAVAVPACAL